jgi:hypothetical protein
MNNEKEITPQFSLWQWIKDKHLIGYFIISTLAFGFQWMRQNQIEQRLENAERSAIHRTETAFALGISGLKQTAVTLENGLIEQRTQNILLLEHCKQNNCKLPVELSTTKDLPKYTPIAETYFGIQQQMIEKSKGE